MFLKIQMNDFMKKIKFSEKYHNITEFMNMVKDVLNQDLNGHKIYFFDQENDKVFIEDEFDLEYLIENSKKKQFQDIFVEKIVNDEEEKVESKIEEPTQEETQPAEFIEISNIHENDYDPQIQSEIQKEEFQVKDETPEQTVEEPEDQVESKLITEVEQPVEISEDKSIEIIEKEEPVEEAEEEIVEEEVKEEPVEQVVEVPVEEVKENLVESIVVEKNLEESFKIENEENQSQSEMQSMTETLSLMQSQIEKLTKKMEKMEKKKDEKKKRKCMKRQCKRNKKCQVMENQNEQTDKVHNYVTCDGCKMYPLTGNRYKCLDCPDYDLCQDCNAKDEHPHNMLLIKNKIPRNGVRKFHKIYNRIKNYQGHNFPFDHIVEQISNHMPIPPFFRGPHMRRMKREERRQEKMRSLDRKMQEDMMKEKSEIMNFVLGETSDEAKLKNRKEFVEKNATMDLENFHSIMLVHKEEF